MVIRSWQDMLSIVSGNLDLLLERYDEEELLAEGLRMHIKVVRMTREHYDDIQSNEY